MTDKELIASLKRLKVQTGSLACLGCGREHNCGIHGCAILREAIAFVEKKLGVPEKRLAEWRRRQGLMRPKYNRARAAAEAEKTTAPAQTLEQKEESMAVMTTSTSAPAEKANKVVTVETLFDLLRGAVDAGYGEAPVTVEHCRFTEMRLRVELLMTGGLRVGGEPVAVELEGVPEAAAGKED